MAVCQVAVKVCAVLTQFARTILERVWRSGNGMKYECGGFWEDFYFDK